MDFFDGHCIERGLLYKDELETTTGTLPHFNQSQGLKPFQDGGS